MKTAEIKLQIQIQLEDLASNCNDEWVSKAQCKQDAYDTYESVLELIEEMYSSITRVEVITDQGRVYPKWCNDDMRLVPSLQDEGRTLKLFEKEM